MKRQLAYRERIQRDDEFRARKEAARRARRQDGVKPDPEEDHPTP
jgi:hypothetical protein